MRATTAFILLLVLSALGGPESFAQPPDGPPAPRIDSVTPVPGDPVPADLIPGVTVYRAEWKSPRGLPDSLCSEHRFPRPDSARFLSDAYRSAQEAAEVDPGIVIFPDVSMDLQITQIEPPENVDPHMMIPRQPGRFESLQYEP
jgi:hypothetical protein